MSVNKLYPNKIVQPPPKNWPMMNINLEPMRGICVMKISIVWN